MSENHKRYVWCDQCQWDAGTRDGLTMGRCDRHRREGWTILLGVVGVCAFAVIMRALS